MHRRRFLLVAGASLCAPLWSRADAVEYPVVQPRTLQFPGDHGAHPDFRTEWWYITGWLNDERGFQLTFFRNRPGVAEDNHSAFAPKQLIFAHAAISDARHGRLLHDQRVARAGFGLAAAREEDTDVHIGDWWLKRTGQGYRTAIAAKDFRFELDFRATQALLLQGEQGVSSKGPRPVEASYYYSRPHLAVSGELSVHGERRAVEGRAWLDHEWSSEYLSREASGWDWCGLNFDDGAAMMAFRIRARDGSVYWTGGTYRDVLGRRTAYAPNEVRFEVLREWRSPHSDAIYPVAMRVHLGPHVVDLEPLMDDQELDSRASTGAIYWEGAMRVLRDGQRVGRGYMELTGYRERLRM